MPSDAEPNGHLQPIRDAKGRFPPGVSGNPSGRPPPDFDLVKRCRNLTPAMVDVWQQVALDPEAKDADRIAAAALVVAYGHGKAPASLALSVAGESDRMFEQRRQVQQVLALYAGARITFADETEQLEAADEDEEADNGDDASTPAEDSGSSV